MDGKWIEIKIVTSSNAVEPVSGIFYGLDVKGVAIEDPNDILDRQQNSLSWDFADTNIFEYGDRAAVVKGYFSQEDDIDNLVSYIEEKLKELEEMGIEVGEAKIVTSVVFEENWSTAWKKYYKTTRLGKRVIIKPLWEEYTPENDEIVVELDPGMAFGTGTHETTMMCVELLEKHVKPGQRVFDIGTGSGILAITASKLGADSVTAVDLDEVAVKAAQENASYNKALNIDIKHGNLVDVVEGQADIIVANIIADVIILLTKTIKQFMKPDSIFIASGIINDRKDDVIDAFNKEGFEIKQVREMGEWVAVIAIQNRG
jgi:ribosomal protein L11 methyltransferase